MKRYQILALIIILVIGAVVVLFTKPTKKGLDLAGGVRVVLRAKAEDLQGGEKWDPSKDLPAVIRVIRNRIDKFGVSEPQIIPKGTDQIIVELPDFDDVDEAVAQLQGTARMEFRHLVNVKNKRHPSAKYEMIVTKDESGNDVYEFVDSQGNPVDTRKVLEESPLILTGDDLLPGKATGTVGSDYRSAVSIEFNNEGRKKFADFTRRNVGEYLAIVLEGKILSAPVINDPILDGKAQITGDFTYEEAQRLADYINAGALPVPLEVVQSQRVEATLGKVSVESSIKAGVIGLALVMIFMIAFYFLPGLLADLALIIYAILTFAVFKLIPVTLTLPGIAAYILSIGMAVDANILIFERLKEELRSGKTLRAAIDAGFSRAFSSILDSNMCTAITSLILMYYGTGPIKGFAVVLFIGVAISMFTAITVTRTFLYLLVDTGLANNPKLFGIRREWVQDQSAPKHLDIVKRMWIWFTLSAVIIIPGLVALFMGGLKGGIDFTGGNIYQVTFANNVTQEQLRSTLEGIGLGDSLIQRATGASGEETFYIRTKILDNEKNLQVKQTIESLGGKVISEDHIGAAVSKELTRNAFWSIVLASIGIILYLTFRFAIGGIKIGFRFGCCAVAALIHDVLVIVGSFAIFGLVFNWEIDSLFVTALLTIIGFSVHDTIVIFDRIRENMRHRVRGEDFDTIANKSILQSITRSINTSATVLLTLISLWIFGAPNIRQFVIALVIGIIIGTYSSIFNASQLLVLWMRAAEKRSPALATATTGAPKPMPKAKEAKPVSANNNGDKQAPLESAETSATASKPKSGGGSSSKKRKRRF